MDPSKVGLVIATPFPGTLTPHMTTFRSAHWFGVLNKAGQHAHRTKTCFRGPSTAADGTASTIRRFRMSVPENLSRKIVASICKEHMRTGKGFNAILAFEVMEDGPHSRPFVSFTSFGPYEDFSAPNCLGVRIEWLTSEGKWKTAPIVYSEMGLQRIWSPMSLHGDASKLMWAWHNVAGLIQMLRDQTCPNARLGGFQRLWSKGCLPMIQTLEIDHLKQTVTWEPRSEPEEVPAPVEATRKHNDEWMATWLMSPVNDLLQFTFPGMHPGAPIFSIDMLSAQLANREGGQECDSCILKRRLRRMTTKIPQCSWNATNQQCLQCAALHRSCTFTPLTALIEGWVGKSPYTEEDILRIENKLMLKTPGAGPFVRWVNWKATSKEEDENDFEIPPPFGWEELLFFVSQDDEEGSAEDSESNDSDSE